MRYPGPRVVDQRLREVDRGAQGARHAGRERGRSMLDYKGAERGECYAFLGHARTAATLI